MNAGSPQILFYPHSARALSSSLIGHLYELSRHYRVAVVTEVLPPLYAAMLEDRRLFPGITEVRTINGLGLSLGSLLRNNRRWHRLAEELVREINPDVVVTENDMSSLFDMYLLRAARRAGARRLTIQGMLQPEADEMRRFVELLYVYRGGRERHPLQRVWRTVSYRVRQHLAHCLVHYLLPWSLGTAALRGGSSYLLRRGASGMRDSELNLVPSQAAFDSHRRSGVPSARLALLAHPLHRVPPELYLGRTPPSAARGTTILILLTSVAFGFRRDPPHQLIDAPSRRATRLAIVGLVRRYFPEAKLVLKPHPDCGPLSAVRDYFSPVAHDMEILPPSSPVEPQLAHCDLVIDLPVSVTTTLFTAACIRRDRPIISANVDNEFYGDHYRHSPEIDYVESLQELEDLLASVAAGRYRKRSMSRPSGPLPLEFANTAAAVGHLLAHPSSSR